jgi:hypothetical protein
MSFYVSIILLARVFGDIISCYVIALIYRHMCHVVVAYTISCYEIVATFHLK